MKKNINILFIVMVVSFVVFYVYFYQKLKAERYFISNTASESQSAMTLTSQVFENGALLPVKYTCDGENINPPLYISFVPQHTVSLALLFTDPDAPVGIYTHWIVWNIDPKITNITENSVPEKAVQGFSDNHKQTYLGPCPSSGSHRYYFTLYALDNNIAPPGEVYRSQFEDAVKGHIIAEARLMGRYEK